MKLVRIDPPGSWCNYQAVFELLEPCGAKSFVDVGCGKGDLSIRLCKKGMKGIGIDFSLLAIEECKSTMDKYINSGNYQLVFGDVMQLQEKNIQQDVALSLMVMEHIVEDVDFIKNIKTIIKPGGHIIVAVPGRMDKWGPEDDTVGHVKRYENYELKQTLQDAGLINVEVWSVAVPIANWLFNLSNFLIRKSGELNKVQSMTMEEQTKTSGVRDIPFKTVFPSWFRLILNKYTLWPLFFIQRFFYKTNLGLTMVARGQVPQEL